jgi:hypothetical protein
MRIRDLPASNDGYLQTHCLSISNETGSMTGYNESRSQGFFDRQNKRARYSWNSGFDGGPAPWAAEAYQG